MDSFKEPETIFVDEENKEFNTKLESKIKILEKNIRSNLLAYDCDRHYEKEKVQCRS